MYFTPFIVTALLPTAISSQWRKIDSHRLTRDEQTWLSTTYVQIFAFIQVLYTPVYLIEPSCCRTAKLVHSSRRTCVLSAKHVLQVVYTALTRKNHENAWVAKVPTWPLVVVFLGQVVAIFGGIYWVVTKGKY